MTTVLAFFRDAFRGPRGIVRSCALVHVVLAGVTACSMAPTYDESAHLAYGIAMLKGNPDRPNPSLASKMPVSVLNAAPRALARGLESTGWLPQLASFLVDIRVTRFSTVLASVGLLMVTSMWARALYGEHAGAAAAMLYTLSPNLLAHASLSTTDLYTTFGAVAASYAFWRFTQTPSRRTMLMSATALGLAQLTKFSAAFLVPVQIITALCLLIAPSGGTDRRLRLPGVAAYFLTAAIASCAIVNAGFLFQRPFQTLRDYAFQSEMFRKAQQIPVLNALPIPLPASYIEGFDKMRNHEQTGVVVSSTYLLGEIRPIASESFTPFYEYYAVVYALKEPIVLQVLLLAGVISVARMRDLAGFMRNEWFLACPLVFYVVYLSVASRMQTGIRFILPSMALGLIVSAAALRNWTTLTQRTRLTVIAGVVWLSASVLSYFPNSISYANEFVHDRKNAWRLYADSNLAWGQNARLVADFLRRNPDVVLNPASPGSGRFLVAVNFLVGLDGAVDYGWLREREPVGHVGYGHILFDVPPVQVDRN